MIFGQNEKKPSYYRVGADTIEDCWRNPSQGASRKVLPPASGELKPEDWLRDQFAAYERRMRRRDRMGKIFVSVLFVVVIALGAYLISR